MGKIRESMEKASYEATKKLFWDVKKLYTTGNVICINQNADEYKDLVDKSRESAAMPVFKEGLIVAYRDDRYPMKESRHYDFLIEELLNYLPDRQAAVSFAEDYVNIDYENLFLPFEAEIKEDGTIEYYIDVFISEYEKGLGKQEDVISTDTMVDLAEYTVCNGGKASPYGTYEAENDGVTCSVVFAGSLNLKISSDKQMQVSGSNPAIVALKDKGYAETAEEAIQIAKENGFTLIHDSHDVVRSVFLSTMRIINYLIEHPEEKTLSKKENPLNQIVVSQILQRVPQNRTRLLNRKSFPLILSSLGRIISKQRKPSGVGNGRESLTVGTFGDITGIIRVGKPCILLPTRKEQTETRELSREKCSSWNNRVKKTPTR